MADNDPDVARAIATARLDLSQAAPDAASVPNASIAERPRTNAAPSANRNAVKPEAATTDLAKAGAGKPDAAKSAAAKSEPAKFNSAKFESVKSDSGKSDSGKSDVTKPSCDESTWAYLDGKCVAGQIRKLRVVRTAPAANTHDGRSGASSGPPSSKAVASNAAPAANADGTASPPVPDQSRRFAAPAGKPQKTAQGQSRRNEQPGGNGMSRRDARAAPGNAANGGAQLPGPFGALFGLLR